MESQILGIDFGTTNSVIAYVADAGPQVIQTPTQSSTLPSVVAYRDDELLVGERAKNAATQYPYRTLHSIKRYMGSQDPIWLGDEQYEPETLAATVIRALVDMAETQLQEPVERAVITVPAYFDYQERSAVKHAGELAGLEVERLLPEPTAACLPYGLRSKSDATVLVYDLGGGTFDVSLVKVTNGIFQVLGTRGDTSLGGDDWDGVVVSWLFDELKTAHGIDLQGEPDIEEQLFDAAKKAKHELTNRQRTTIELPYLAHGDQQYPLEATLTRSDFEQYTADLLERTVECCETLLDETDVPTSTLDEVVLVGGATRMPQIETMLKETFGCSPSNEVDQDLAVAYGAAIQGAILDRQGLPADDMNRSVEVASNQQIQPEDVTLLNVAAKPLGVRAQDSDTGELRFFELIGRNETIPTSGNDIFTTIEDEQEYVKSEVLQSQTGDLDDAIVLERFRIGPLPPLPAGEPDIQVEFQLDADGVLQAEVVEQGSGISTSVEAEPELDQKRRERLDDVSLPDVIY